MTTPTAGLLHIALAAFVAARGGTADEADNLSCVLATAPLPGSPGEAFAQLDAALTAMRAGQ